jgi:dTDP-4-amino-4,6-dideoxygalactose transaminase
MTDIQAALGIIQLQRLEQMTVQRIANATFLTEQLGGKVQTPSVRPEHRHVYHQYTIQVPQDRDQWVRHLRERGVGTAVHYPVPIHQQPFYLARKNIYRCVGSYETKHSSSDTHLPITEKAAQHVLSLPVHPALKPTDLITIAKEVLALCH